MPQLPPPPPTQEIAALKQHLDYAVWAYEMETEKLQECFAGTDFEIRQHNSLLPNQRQRPGHVGHYVAVSLQQKQIIVGIRGTSSLEDLLTDCCGRAVRYRSDEDDEVSARVEVRAAQPHQIHCHDGDDESAIEITSGHERIWILEDSNHDDDDDNNDDAIRCHEGILICAKRLANQIQPLIQQLVLEEDYRVVLCGHSLGAGVASLVAVVLRTRLPELAHHHLCSSSSNHSDNNTDDEPCKMQVFAFAPPPVLDHDSAAAASSYTVSVVNNADLIPRSSLANLTVLLQVLRTVSERLVERKLAPTGPAGTAALIRKLTQKLEKVTPADLLLSRDEVRTAIDEAQHQVPLRDPHHLYIPGRVRLLYEPRDASREGNDSRSSNKDEGTVQRHHYSCIPTDPSAGALRFLELDAFRIVTDHITASYYASLENLLLLGGHGGGGGSPLAAAEQQ